MRRLLPVALAGLLAAGAMNSAGAQSQLGTPDNGTQEGGAIAVPPAPPIVASPPTPLTPAAPATPAPPGLVPISPPSGMTGNMDSGGTENGNADNGSADNGSADNGDTGAAPAPVVVPPVAEPGNATPGATPGQPAPGQADNGQNQPQDQDVIPTPPNSWQPGKVAEIGVLDKVGGEVKQIAIPVGGQLVVGDLQVNVLACVTRPPDQLPDAAAFLALQNTDNLSGPPNYRGWLIRSEPGAALAGDASETFRVIDCSQG